MATQCTLAPFINQEFYITGTWGEQRPSHLHAGLDLATGGQNDVYNMKDGYAIHVDGSGTDGSGYRSEHNYSEFGWNYMALW